jgi:hypothetical protein
VIASRLTASFGGRSLIFIDYLGPSQRLLFNRNESLISPSADTLHIFRILGVLDPHVQG